MLTESDRVWRLLNGIFCVYKPPGTTFKYVIERVRSNLCRDLNNMKTRPVEKFLEVNVKDDQLQTKVRPSYADNVLCVGPRYQPEDICIHIPTLLGRLSSGVMVVGINSGHKISDVLRRLNFTRCYRLKGLLGLATRHFHIEDEIIAKSSYEHVDFERFQKILAFRQSVAQRLSFEEYGFTLTSEEAYNFATKGVYRPDKKGAPIAYSLQLVEFKPPEFTIEVQCVHETEDYLKYLIHDLGSSLKCYATCTGLRCIRQGYFNVDHALLKKYWTADCIVDNIKTCAKILQEDYPAKLMQSPTVTTIEKPLLQIQLLDVTSKYDFQQAGEFQ